MLEKKKWLYDASITDRTSVLEQAAVQAFYNTAPLTLRVLTTRASQQLVRDDFIAYFDGSSPNEQAVLDNFEFRHQINRLSIGDALATLIEHYSSPDFNYSPEPIMNVDGSIRTPELDNHAIGMIFEDLVRRLNEDTSEEAGEYWTPRVAVELMAQLVFRPVANHIQSGTYLRYDGGRSSPSTSTARRPTRKPTPYAKPICY